MINCLRRWVSRTTRYTARHSGVAAGAALNADARRRVQRTVSDSSCRANRRAKTIAVGVVIGGTDRALCERGAGRAVGIGISCARARSGLNDLRDRGEREGGGVLRDVNPPKCAIEDHSWG